jgi:hypothetical protein
VSIPARSGHRWVSVCEVQRTWQVRHVKNVPEVAGGARQFVDGYEYSALLRHRRPRVPRLVKEHPVNRGAAPRLVIAALWTLCSACSADGPNDSGGPSGSSGDSGATSAGGLGGTGGVSGGTNIGPGGTTGASGGGLGTGGATASGGRGATGGTAGIGGSVRNGGAAGQSSGGEAGAGIGGSTGTASVVYQVIQGHDGDYDPDDNLAQLTGMMAVFHNSKTYPGQVEMVGIVFGDTTVGHKTNMKGSGEGHANWQFWQQYSAPAVGDATMAWYPATNVLDCVGQSWSFDATQVSQLSTGGQLIYTTLKAALDVSNTNTNRRVVYSAGGGHNAAYEAIQLLRKSTNPIYTDAQIVAHFAIVQHSDWNMDNTNEAGVLAATLPFTIRISDQNGPAGAGKCGIEPTLAKTSALFIKASRVARGVQAPEQPIAAFATTTDCSDAGGSDFSSIPSIMEANWNTRNNRSNAISYNAFNTAKITSIMQ